MPYQTYGIGNLIPFLVIWSISVTVADLVQRHRPGSCLSHRARIGCLPATVNAAHLSKADQWWCVFSFVTVLNNHRPDIYIGQFNNILSDMVNQRRGVNDGTYSALLLFCPITYQTYGIGHSMPSRVVWSISIIVADWVQKYRSGICLSYCARIGHPPVIVNATHLSKASWWWCIFSFVAILTNHLSDIRDWPFNAIPSYLVSQWLTWSRNTGQAAAYRSVPE
jgi:hypothetical protein